MITQRMTASTMTMTTPPATSGIGWLQGIESQVSLPSTLVASCCRVNGLAALRLRARARRQFLCSDVVEQVRSDRAVGVRRNVLARLRQRDVSRGIERRTLLMCRRDPLLELVRRQGAHRKFHPGEAATAVLARQSEKFAGLVGLQPKLGDHGIHLR